MYVCMYLYSSHLLRNKIDCSGKNCLKLCYKKIKCETYFAKMQCSFLSCDRYMVDGGNQPGIKVLRAARVFNPSHAAGVMTDERKLYDAALPGFQDCNQDEFRLYIELAKRVVSDNADSNTDSHDFVNAFWRCKKEILPTLYSLFCIYKNVSSSSADTERSFSRVKSILSPKRMSMSQDTLRFLTFLN